jgi:hypothetical protein
LLRLSFSLLLAALRGGSFPFLTVSFSIIN